MKMNVIQNLRGLVRQKILPSLSSFSQPYTTVPKDVNTNDVDEETPIPFSSIPGEKILPLIGTVRLRTFTEFQGKIHEHMKCRFKTFGPIYREKFGPKVIVLTCDPQAIEKLHRQEPAFPKRFGFELWTDWRQRHGLELGILTVNDDGDKWRRMRSALDKTLMRPISVAGYVNNFNNVATEFVQRVRQLRDGGGKVATIDNEIFNWSLESVSTVLYDIRLGCLSDQRDPDMQSFIDAVNKMFKLSETLVNIPVPVLKLLMKKKMKEHDETWKAIFRSTKKLVDSKLSEIENQLENGEAPSGFIAGLLAKEQLSRPELYSNISELMAAAVDTTSNTTQFALDLLAHNPDVQNDLFLEISRVVGKGLPTYSDLQKMPYLRGFIREVQRLYPTALGATRILDEEIVLCNYIIPAETLIVTCQFMTGRDPRYFPDPDQVQPERWFRGSEEKEKINPFTALPFGYGPRSCIGRRVAEMEMYTLIAQLCQNFILKSESGVPVPIATRMLLVPQYPVDVQFIDRK